MVSIIYNSVVDIRTLIRVKFNNIFWWHFYYQAHKQKLHIIQIKLEVRRILIKQKRYKSFRNCFMWIRINQRKLVKVYVREEFTVWRLFRTSIKFIIRSCLLKHRLNFHGKQNVTYWYWMVSAAVSIEFIFRYFFVKSL